MLVGVLQLDLNIYQVASLKGKRAVVRKILGRLRNRFPVSAAEVGLYDSWQRAALGFSVVAVERGQIEALFEKIEAEIEGSGLADLGERRAEILSF
ncbi:hypothetical protein EDC39_102242 [Geothermobacter ehrlichii]|uniref:DUF503 domain-containing protein n=1 Tax=Geothermobacter ehrlichii TaxID=213224 RepID=A0A5D3WMV2_9BACT|nr:DUF503 domain-containing protein [Geothermobacter ehrlichii]TYO99716.1 hypothetical protein EDC39_102242 [Geothermobacter ehrlichii]